LFIYSQEKTILPLWRAIDGEELSKPKCIKVVFNFGFTAARNLKRLLITGLARTMLHTSVYK